jgi:WhiB family redox-sensing transcriptional regulator
VLVGYARHDAYPGGGYFVVRAPTGGVATAFSPADHPPAIAFLPFAFVRAYATALWTAEPEIAGASDGRDRDAIGHRPELTPADRDTDRAIAARARCADPRAAYTPLFFSENPFDTLRAKAICSVCPVQTPCLRRAVERREPYGVWGGEFFLDGVLVGIKRGRGRPARQPLPAVVDEVTGVPVPLSGAVA